MTENLLEKTIRVSRRMALAARTIAVLMIISFAIAFFWTAIEPSWLIDLIQTRFGGRIAALSGLQIAGIGALFLVQLGMLVMALLALARMFDCFTSTEPLSVEAAHWMRRCGQWILAGTIFAIFAQVPISMLASLQNGPGERFINVSMGSNHLSGILAAAVLLSIAYVHRLAAEMREDHRQIV